MAIIPHIFAGCLVVKFLRHFTVILPLLCLWNRKELQNFWNLPPGLSWRLQCYEESGCMCIQGCLSRTLYFSWAVSTWACLCYLENRLVFFIITDMWFLNSTSSALAKLSKVASGGTGKTPQTEKKETPQERLKRIMSKQLNKQSMC